MKSKNTTSLKDYLTIGESAKYLGVASMTLRRWDKAGRLKAYRHPVNGYRLYLKADLEALLGKIKRGVTARGD